MENEKQGEAIVVDSQEKLKEIIMELSAREDIGSILVEVAQDE